jgi:3-oxoacyl-[acyl-carrier-protein] synthase-3
MNGKEVFKHAVEKLSSCLLEAINDANLKIQDIDFLVPHQANLRIIEAITDRMGISSENTFVNLDKYGNTSAAAVAIALDEANKSQAIKDGDIVLLVAFGAGLTWASCLIKW